MSPGRVQRVVLLGLIAYRALYHLLYLTRDPFAQGTFSDGRVYETAARDIVAHPPLGQVAFYLQGLYAAFLALGLQLGGSIWSCAALQVALAGLALWAFYRSACTALGAQAGTLSTIVLLAYPALAFYENKFLSAELGVACNILALAALVRFSTAPSPWAALLCGAAAAATVLARPNLLGAVPFTAAAIYLLSRRQGRPPARAVAVFALGVVLGLAPMALRNQAVTGHPSVFPVHGGGTSFYIGSNPASRGLWNNAGVLSGEVDSEQEEFAAWLGLPAEPRGVLQAQQIGRALYLRAFDYIAAHPAQWLGLELRKLWLSIGNDEISQDYSLPGEQEILPFAHRLGLPFGVVLGLGLLGLALLAAQPTHRPLLLGLAGQLLAVLASCVLFFTSAQHRLPLVVPLAFLSGPALLYLWDLVRRRQQGLLSGRRRAVVLCAAAALCAQAALPREQARRIPSSHYYNLAMVQDRLGDAPGALRALDRAIERNPRQALFYLQRGRLLLQLGQFDQALPALERARDIAGTQGPQWIRDQAEHALSRLHSR